MAIYAVGDIQGCCDEFEALLAQLRFDPDRDRLWLTGDLVNRLAFEDMFGQTLSHLSMHLHEGGQQEEAVQTAKEATQIRRKLAEKKPHQFTPALADSLTALGVAYHGDGHKQEALAATQEAVKLYRRLAEVHPGPYYQAATAGALDNLGIRLAKLNRWNEAISAADEATRLFRRLRTSDPQRYTHNLAMTLANFSAHLGHAARHDEALPLAEETVQLHQQLAHGNHQKFGPDLAKALLVLAMERLATHRDLPLFWETLHEGIEILIPFARAEPQVFAKPLYEQYRVATMFFDLVGAKEEAAAIRHLLDSNDPNSNLLIFHFDVQPT